MSAIEHRRRSGEAALDTCVVASYAKGVWKSSSPRPGGVHSPGHRDLVSDWQFNIAYNAALQLASAAWAASGYEAERANHHYRVIHSLEFTLGADATTISKFDVFRKKRNITDYEKADTISEAETEEMQQLAETLLAKVDAWIRKNHPQFVP